MSRLSLWNSGLKGNDYRFFDRQISEMFGMGGTAIYVHKYIGSYDSAGNPTPVTSIQDPLFLENRDRRYDPLTYELYGVYNVQDAEFDLRQFGLFLDNDTLFISFHLNDMVQKMGRKLLSGDVLELPHLRDTYLLNDAPALNKYYLVTDANRSSEGYSPTWWEHVWRVKVTPMPNSQEFSDITPAQGPFGDPDPSIPSVPGTPGTPALPGVPPGILGVLNEQIVDSAKLSVPKRNFETQQFYVIPGDETCAQNPWIFAGDGIPPDGALLTGSGRVYPINPTEGTYYLRTDYQPHVLFRFVNGVWRRQELDYRMTDWSMAHRILLSFINNDNTATYDDFSTHPEKIALSKAVKPIADF